MHTKEKSGLATRDYIYGHAASYLRKFAATSLLKLTCSFNKSLACSCKVPNLTSPVKTTG